MEVACVPASKLLLAGLPGCLGPQWAEEEHGFWRHPLGRHRQSIYHVPRMVSGDTAKGKMLKSSGGGQQVTRQF